MDLVANVRTRINQCVLPLLPTFLTTRLHHDPRAHVALAIGMGLPFVVPDTGLAALGPAGAVLALSDTALVAG